MTRPGENALDELLKLLCDQRSDPVAVRSYGEDYPGDSGTIRARDLARRYYRVSLTLSRWTRVPGTTWWEARVLSVLTSRRAP
jgi:hypothetical protein